MPEHSTPSDRDAAISVIRTALVEKKMTQAELADAADCHEKTVQNMMAGRSVRDQTLFDVCMVLGLDYTELKHAWSGASVSGPMELRGEGGAMAPVYMGAYTRAGVDHYIGSYLTLRPAFSKPEMIIAYRTQIIWDPSWPSLLFEEHDRPDANYQHRGRIYVPASSSFIHLVSLTKGAMRMVMVSQLDQAGHMRGLISTLNRQGAMLLPVSAPLAYVKLAADQATDGAMTAYGQITPDNPAYAAYHAQLSDTVSEGYARLISV